MANKTIKSTGPYRHVSYERVSKQWTGFKGFKKFLWPAEIIVAPLLRFPAALVLIWSQSNVKVELEKERNSSHFTDERNFLCSGDHFFVVGGLTKDIVEVITDQSMRTWIFEYSFTYLFYADFSLVVHFPYEDSAQEGLDREVKVRVM